MPVSTDAPTFAPSAGQFTSPTPSPGSGLFTNPTASPSAGAFTNPTPSPSQGSFTSPTPSPSVGQFTNPTPSPGDLCVSGWLDWVNDNSPVNSAGDTEQLSAAQLSQLCPGGTVTDIQCVDAVTGDDWVSLAEASCSVKEGLSCTNLPFPGVPPCHDYKIRYMCNCSGQFFL